MKRTTFLFACHTGEKDGIAQKLSNVQKFKGDVFVGAIGIVKSGKEPRKSADSEKYIGAERGWGVYRNGKLLTTLPGWLVPNEGLIKFILLFKGIDEN